MLRVTAIADSGAAKAYFKLSDYLVEGQELAARWHGKGAEKLGLSGEVNYADFEKLCDNINPVTGQQLTLRTVANRKVGYDFTFSVPKSVSVAFALGHDDRLPDALRGAVADTMAEIEREMETQVRKQGQVDKRRTGNMIWADFLHTTSRPIKGQPDPQLHVHAVAFNATLDPVEYQWKAGEFVNLKRNAPYFQSVFRSRLAKRLQDLGYSVDRTTRDDFEISGIPKEVNKEFSRRTDLIEKLAEKLNIKSPEAKAKLGATSRDKKVKGLTWQELGNLWRDRVTDSEHKAILDTVVRSQREPHQHGLDISREAVDYALRHLLERDSVVPQRAVAMEALKYGMGEVTPESVYREIASRKDLIRRNVKGVEVVTTQGVLSEEKRIKDFAIRGRGRHARLASKQAINSANFDGLTKSQADAVRHVWTSPDRLMLIRGAAGTGKTTLTKAALAGVNVPWVILAPSAEASRGVLRRDGFEGADTLAKFLNDGAMQERVRGGLIWLDEASLAGAHDMAKLVELADSLNARVVLSGDRRQHKSVSRGDILSLLEDRAGLPVAEVSEIMRQKGDYKKAAEMLSKGKVVDGFKMLDAMGWVIDGKQTDSLADDLAADYLATLKAGKSVLAISPTHAQGAMITDAIRDTLRADGRLKGDDHTIARLNPLNLTKAEMELAKQRGAEGVVFTRFGAYQKDEMKLAAGDSIRITASVKDITGKHRMNSGTIYTVDSFTKDGHIRLNNGWVLDKSVSHITHGYVVTSHASQGKTVDVALLAMGNDSLGAAGAEQFYVSASRAKQQTKIYVDDKAAVLEAIQREDLRLLASDIVQEPRRGLRDRMKRHLAFLRRVTGRGPERINQQQKEQQYERTY